MATRTPVKVCVRIRPTPHFAPELILSGDSITVDRPATEQIAGGLSGKRLPFAFDSVLNNASQGEVFETCARDIVGSVLAGINGTVLVYGQTGAGKTYTMTGDPSLSYSTRGLIPRVLSEVFREVSARPSAAFTVRCSYLEIYKDRMIDLLRTTQGEFDAATGAGVAGEERDGAPDGPLVIREDASGATTVHNLLTPVVQTEQDALALLFEGNAARVVTAHKLNSNSSRSHCIFTLYVEQRSRVDEAADVLISKLHLCDLAGSERVGKTGSSGVVLEEASYINRSLSFLEQVVLALADKRRDHIPYRQTRLTSVLRDSLGGNSITRLIANVSGESQHLEETISTLRFATRVARVENTAKANVVRDARQYIRKLEKELAQLRQELGLARASGAASLTLSQDDRTAIGQEVRLFVAGEVDELPVRSAAQVLEAFDQLRALARAGGAIGLPQVSGGGSRLSHGEESEIAARVAQAVDLGGVGEASITGALTLGATGVAAPARVLAGSLDALLDNQQSSGRGFAKAAPASSLLAPGASKDDAFEVFKAGDGRALADAVTANKAETKAAKHALRDAAAVVNAAKARIDELQAQASSNGDSADGVMDARHISLLQALSEAKTEYRDAYASVKDAKTRLAAIQQTVDASQRHLVVSFSEWWARATAAGQGEEVEDGAEGMVLDQAAFDGAKRRMAATMRGSRKI
jgi:kinesin family protein 6/9